RAAARNRTGRCALVLSLPFRGGRRDAKASSGWSHRGDPTPPPSAATLPYRGGKSSCVRLDPGGDDPVGIAHRLAAPDLVNVFHAGDRFAPHGVLAVEPQGIGEADEELTVGGIGVLRTRHRNRAAHMRLAGEFGRELFARAAAAGPGRVTGLRHEAFDHAVKY